MLKCESIREKLFLKKKRSIKIKLLFTYTNIPLQAGHAAASPCLVVTNCPTNINCNCKAITSTDYIHLQSKDMSRVYEMLTKQIQNKQADERGAKDRISHKLPLKMLN